GNRRGGGAGQRPGLSQFRRRLPPGFHRQHRPRRRRDLPLRRARPDGPRGPADPRARLAARVERADDRRHPSGADRDSGLSAGGAAPGVGQTSNNSIALPSAANSPAASPPPRPQPPSRVTVSSPTATPPLAAS